MKLLWPTLLLVFTVAAFSQDQCVRVQFSGEATQSHKYIQPIQDHLALVVNPMHLKEDPRWTWFEISIVPNSDDGVFVFALGDRNWLLDVSDFWSVFMGGPNSDLNSALEYRSRYFVFPVKADDKERGREAARLVVGASGPEQLQSAITALNGMHLAHLKFDMTNYGLGTGDVPRSVDWVKFDVTLTLPPGVQALRAVSSALVPCPVIPAELIENIRTPERHKYVVAADERRQP